MIELIAPTADKPLIDAISREELLFLQDNLDKLSRADQEELLEVVQELEHRRYRAQAHASLLGFACAMNPNYRIGSHHKRLANLLESVDRGERDRLAVSVAPRMGKSLLISVMFCAWYLGKHPEQSIILASHTGDLAVDFGRTIRNIIASNTFKGIFPGVSLAADSKSAGRWNTNHGGGFYATGVGSALAGRGADVCVHPDSIVLTQRGAIKASDVTLQDKLWTHDGSRQVEVIIHTSGSQTVHLAGMRLTPEHPLWVFNKGWVRAGEVQAGDVLWTMGFCDKVVSSLWRRYHEAKTTWNDIYAHLQRMGHDEAAMQQPARGQLHPLRRAWNKGVRTLESVREFLRGHGGYTGRENVGPYRLKWGLLQRELQVGGCSYAKQEQTQFHMDNSVRKEETYRSVDRGNWSDARYDSAQNRYHEDDTGRSSDAQKDESQSPASSPDCFGWLRRTAIRFCSACYEKRVAARARRQQAQGTVASAENTLRACRLLGRIVGVHLVEEVAVDQHEQHPFINFQVDGDHTYVVDSVLTHNCIIDDPISEQSLLTGNTTDFTKVYDWFTMGVRTRLTKTGKIVIVHTRWHPLDLIGRLISDMANNEDSDQYEIFEFPAILNENTDHEQALWPEFFPLEALHRTKASMPLFQWNAQYQQHPTTEQGAIVKRDSWKPWTLDDPPKCSYVILTLDAAAETKTRNDFTAVTVWGVFKHEQLTNGENHIILLNAVNVRVAFPALKALAMRMYKEWKPDSFIVEKKSNGTALYQEMRRMGLAVTEYNPSRATGDKMARLNAVSDIFANGVVWYPQGRKWAEQVIEQVAGFPAVEHDDLVDCVTMALARFREGGFLQLSTDEKDVEHMPADYSYY